MLYGGKQVKKGTVSCHDCGRKIDPNGPKAITQIREIVDGVRGRVPICRVCYEGRRR